MVFLFINKEYLFIVSVKGIYHYSGETGMGGVKPYAQSSRLKAEQNGVKSTLNLYCEGRGVKGGNGDWEKRGWGDTPVPRFFFSVL